MLKLLKVGSCLAPGSEEATEILVAAEKVIAIGHDLANNLAGFESEIIDCGTKSIAVPGLIDQHVHILGGGGEGGYHTRVPELMLSEIVRCGVTTVVGMLGTDDVTRHLESLLAKALALETEGITAYILTGSYALPTPTLTGSVKRDLVLIDKVLGAGEIAQSDHRASKAGYQALKDVAAACRLGGLLSGKAGLLHLHLGDDPEGLAPVRRLVEERVIPIRQIVVTHVNRNRRLFLEAVDYLRAGGNIDLTSFAFPGDDALTVVAAIKKLKAEGLSLERVTVSSDANGSMPRVDDQGQVIGLLAASMDTLLADLQALYREEVLDLKELLALVTTNPARLLGLPHKGTLTVGADADITVFDSELNVNHVLARGQVMVAAGAVVKKGTFE